MHRLAADCFELIDDSGEATGVYEIEVSFSPKGGNSGLETINSEHVRIVPNIISFVKSTKRKLNPPGETTPHLLPVKTPPR
jgi:hypothetical protein